jgi:UDPglucose 6-dehydrogenase
MNAVSVVGLGKLGACVAAAMAHKGLEVVGVDIDDQVIADINSRQAPVHEPGLAEMLTTSDRIRATTDFQDAIRSTDLTFIIVPTPSEPNGGFSLRHVNTVGDAVGRALRHKRDYHLIVLASTVLPGSTEGALLPILEGASGKECGGAFGLCYSPQFIALGTVMRDFLEPDLVLIGESDARAGEALSQIYERVLDRNSPIQRMTIPNAELTKVALNAFVTTKITFANMLAEMCERLPGGDVDVVTTALGLDSRVGSRYLAAGLGFGGPCFPRDNAALRFWSGTVGAPAALAMSTDELNREHAEHIVSRVADRCGPGGTVGVLGLTYKPGTPVLEGSAPLEIARELVERGLPVIAYDPLAGSFPENAVDARIQLVGSLPEALAGADVVVVANPDAAFARLTPDDFAGRTVTVFDCWRLLRTELESATGIEYVALGLGSEPRNTPRIEGDLSATFR